MRYLSLEEVLAIHLEAIQEFGGAPEVLDAERLKSCLESPRQTMFGEALYPDLASKTAILFFMLIKNHPFLDGNKRTAVLALMEFLNRNDHCLQASNDELYDFTIAVATSRLDKNQITDWIRSRIRKAEP